MTQKQGKNWVYDWKNPVFACLCRLLAQQPVVKTAGVEFTDAVLNFAEMALLDLGEALPLFGLRANVDPLLVEQVHFAIQMLHQVEQGVSLLDLLRVELPCEVPHPVALKDCLIIS